MGTTGENATLSHEEHHLAIDITVDEARKSRKDPFVLLPLFYLIDHSCIFKFMSNTGLLLYIY